MDEIYLAIAGQAVIAAMYALDLHYLLMAAVEHSHRPEPPGRMGIERYTLIVQHLTIRETRAYIRTVVGLCFCASLNALLWSLEAANCLHLTSSMIARDVLKCSFTVMGVLIVVMYRLGRTARRRVPLNASAVQLTPPAG